MLCRLMQNKPSSIGAELERDQCKGVEMRELNDTKKIYLTCPFRKIIYGNPAHLQIRWYTQRQNRTENKRKYIEGVSLKMTGIRPMAPLQNGGPLNDL